MKKLSIKHRTLIVLSFSLAGVFLLLLLSFNVLLNGFIRKDAQTELKNSLQAINTYFRENNILQKVESETGTVAESLKKILKYSKVKSFFKSQEFIITDRNLKVLLPKKQDDTGLSRQDAEAVLSYYDKNSLPKKPVEIKAGGRVYYVASMPLKLNTDSTKGHVFLLTDVTSLNTLRERINEVLLLSLLLSALAAIGVVVAYSSGTVHAIQRLCQFARSIGNGDFKNRDMDFKDKELQELCDSMNTMALRLNDQETQQKVFFQNISHELKTPLMSIQGYAEGIKFGVLQSKEKSCDIIIHECIRLSEMVNDLLFLSKFDSKADILKLSRTDLTQLLVDTSESLYGYAVQSNKTITLDLPSHPVLELIDEEKMMRAISNIISNCIRFAKTCVTVSMTADPRNTIIRVSDDGPGIDLKDMPHLFERLYKGKNGNFGLGLSITKAVVDAHNGSIRAENTKSGALFTLTLSKQ